MLQPFIWMFKTEGFKKHLIYLLSIIYGMYALVVLLILAAHFFTQYQLYLCIAAGILIVMAILCVQGYFWCLASNVAERSLDIDTADIYDGKIKEVITIELPQIKTSKFIWRGIASWFASVLFFYPLAILLIIPAVLSGLTFQNPLAGGVTYLVLYGFIGLFIPALLWNYAIRDSVVAMWNIPKAIHIMGSYTGRYIWNTILFLLISFIYNAAITGFQIFTGISNFSPLVFTETQVIINTVIFLLILPIPNIYCLFINAYLLGTIAPPSEA